MQLLRTPQYVRYTGDAGLKALIRSAGLDDSTSASIAHAVVQPEFGEQILKLLRVRGHDDVIVDLLLSNELGDGDYSLLEELGICVVVDGELYVHEPLVINILLESAHIVHRVAPLLASLEDERLTSLNRPWEVGQKTSHIEQAISLRDQICTEDRLSQKLATLTEPERKPLRAALSEETVDPPITADNDAIDLHDSAAGELGLIFVVSNTRMVIPIELRELVKAGLESIPAAPEEITRKRRRRRRGSSSRRKRSSKSSTSPSKQKESEDAASAAETTKELAEDIGRSVSVSTASALVELRSVREVQIALRDKELGAAVLEVLEDTLVILRASVQAEEWAQRLAVRIEEEL